MKYTEYEWRTEMLTRSFKKLVVDELYTKKMKKKLRSLSRQERNEFLRVNALVNEFVSRFEMIANKGFPEEERTAMLSDTMITMGQLTHELAWRQGGREAWYPETQHLLEVLEKVDFNAHPEELYSGEMVSRLIHFPRGYKIEGRPLRSVLVTLATVGQWGAVWDDLADRNKLPSVLSGVRPEGREDTVRIFIATCCETDFFVADFELSRMASLIRSKVEEYELRCITPYDFSGLIPAELMEDQTLTRKLCLDHFNIALRLLIYAQAFPEVLVDFEQPRVKGRIRQRCRYLAPHPRIKQDYETVRYITHRVGYNRRAHTKVLRAPRFKRNEDGTPKEVPVAACWVPPIGYIGSRKKTVKELEAAALKKAG